MHWRRCILDPVLTLALSFITSYWMSASGSATPTNTNRPPSSSSDQPTISRPHESSPTFQSLVGEREEISTQLRSTPTHSPIQQPSSARRRLTDSPPSAPMAKRLRKDSPQAKHDSPSSDSQGGMDDTEDLPTMQTHHSEMSTPPATAPKKKRTRTLTTPAQSAVLHALLAKVRFNSQPTTQLNLIYPTVPLPDYCSTRRGW